MRSEDGAIDVGVRYADGPVAEHLTTYRRTYIMTYIAVEDGKEFTVHGEINSMPTGGMIDLVIDGTLRGTILHSKRLENNFVFSFKTGIFRTEKSLRVAPLCFGTLTSVPVNAAEDDKAGVGHIDIHISFPHKSGSCYQHEYPDPDYEYSHAVPDHGIAKYAVEPDLQVVLQAGVEANLTQSQRQTVRRNWTIKRPGSDYHKRFRFVYRSHKALQERGILELSEMVKQTGRPIDSKKHVELPLLLPVKRRVSEEPDAPQQYTKRAKSEVLETLPNGLVKVKDEYADTPLRSKFELQTKREEVHQLSSVLKAAEERADARYEEITGKVLKRKERNDEYLELVDKKAGLERYIAAANRRDEQYLALLREYADDEVSDEAADHGE